LKFLFIASFFSLFCFQNLSKSSFSLNFPFFVKRVGEFEAVGGEGKKRSREMIRHAAAEGAREPSAASFHELSRSFFSRASLKAATPPAGCARHHQHPPTSEIALHQKLSAHQITSARDTFSRISSFY
jgi:hypothetical protein